MARATRSSATQLHDKQQDPPATARTKPSLKKRKRTSLPDNDDHPTPKQLCIKEENIHDHPDLNPKLQNLPLAADAPLDPDDAQHILAILDL